MKALIAVALVAVVLSGCGPHGLVGHLPEIDDSEDTAQIYIIRVSSFNSKMMNYKVAFDGFELLGIGNGEYTRFLVSPGDHTVAIATKKGIADRATQINVFCEPSGKYYLLVKPGMSSVKITEVNADEAKPIIAESKYLEIDFRVK